MVLMKNLLKQYERKTKDRQRVINSKEHLEKKGKWLRYEESQLIIEKNLEEIDFLFSLFDSLCIAKWNTRHRLNYYLGTGFNDIVKLWKAITVGLFLGSKTP
eukprot:Pgem_evm1s14499